MSISITVPNDDHVALRAMAKALEEIAVARGAPGKEPVVHDLSFKLNIDTSEATAALEKLRDSTKDYPHDEVAERISTAREELEQAAPAMLESITDEELDDFCPPPASDSAGEPWDARIHAESKSLNKDGTWRTRRKPKDMDEVEWLALVKEVKAELSEGTFYWCHGESDSTGFCASRKELNDLIDSGAGCVSEITKEEYESLNAEPPVVSAADVFHIDTGEVTEQQVVSIPVPPLPPIPVPPVPVAADVVTTFPQLMKFLTEKHGKLKVEDVNSAVMRQGLSTIQDLNQKPELIPSFVADIKNMIGE